MSGPERTLLTFLLNALWQLPLLVVVAWAGSVLLARAPAAYRHRVWLAALTLCLLVPLASALRPSQVAVRPLGGRGGFALDAVGSESIPRAVDVNSHALAAELPPLLARSVVVVYVLILLVFGVRLLRAWRRTQRIVRAAAEAPAALGALAVECAAGLGVPHVALRVSNAIAAPMTFGLRRPVVVLPRVFAETGSAEAVRGVLGHELAHVRRHDCGVNVLCELLALPLGFHPVVGLLRRRLAGARESACDEAAVGLVGRRSYATTLLDVARLATRQRRWAGAVGALDGDCLEDRMKRILETQARLGRRQAVALFGVAVLSMALVGRGAAAAAVNVATEPGPADMVGTWIGLFGDSDPAAKPAADLTIALGPRGPEIALTLYRYVHGSTDKPAAVPLPVVEHHVENGVLHFRTRDENVRLKAGEAPLTMVSDWEFSVVGKESGRLVAHNRTLEALEAQGKDVPPKGPPLVMKRVR